MSGVFGQRWHTVQLQVITVDGATDARAQQASGHTCSKMMGEEGGDGNEVMNTGKKIKIKEYNFIVQSVCKAIRLPESRAKISQIWV